MDEYEVEIGVGEEFLKDTLNKYAKDKKTKWRLLMIVPYQIISLGAEQIRYTVIFITQRAGKPMFED